jgi:hypothetical protein
MMMMEEKYMTVWGLERLQEGCNGAVFQGGAFSFGELRKD